MKDLYHVLVISLIWVVFLIPCYLFGALVNKDFNFISWGEFSRFFAGLYLTLTFFIAIYTYVDKNEKKDLQGESKG